MSADKPVPAAADSDSDSPAVTSAKKGSPLRLAIMSAVLAILLVALGYDYLIARPAVAGAMERLNKAVEESHRQGVDKSQLIHRDDVQQVIGFAPTRTETQGQSTIEWYCWWGKMPLLSERRRYMWVRYDGNEPQYVSTFDFDNKPEDNPSPENPAVSADTPLPMPGKLGHGDGKSHAVAAPENASDEKPTPAATENP